MKQRQEGFILMVMLCMISIISVLVLTCMQHVLVYYKAINRQELQHQDFYQLEEIALQLAQSHRDISCISAQDDANAALRQVLHNKGCSLGVGAMQYHYIIEHLGVYPCLVVWKNQRTYGTQHIRITVIRAPNEAHPEASIIQLRYIKAAASKTTCDTTEHVIETGVSSWRFVSDYPETGS